MWVWPWTQKVCFVDTNGRIDFYELWQQHKQPKTMEIKEAWPDIYDEGSVPTWTQSQNSEGLAEAQSLNLLWDVYLMITKSIPISATIIKSCAMKSSTAKWKTRQHYQNSLIEGGIFVLFGRYVWENWKSQFSGKEPYYVQWQRKYIKNCRYFVKTTFVGKYFLRK